eukprot:GAHX01001772.1.p1 GENE.GAHX01001772.1~~GAHX01001772.1.p1  ORF type:complete len:613 (-),score=135.01 GAHX01001772.1:313-2091(-)
MSIRQINRLKTLLNLNKTHINLTPEEEQKLQVRILQNHLERNNITFDDLEMAPLPIEFKNITSLIDTLNIDDSKYDNIASLQHQLDNITTSSTQAPLIFKEDIAPQPQQQAIIKTNMFDDYYLPVNTHSLHYNFKTKKFLKPKSKAFILSDIAHNNKFTSELKDQVEISIAKTTIDNPERFNNAINFITLSYTKSFFNKYNKFSKQMNQNYIAKNIHFIPVFMEIMQRNIESNNLKQYSEGVSKLLYIFERCLIVIKDYINQPNYFINNEILHEDVCLEDKFNLVPAEVLFKTLFLKIKYSYLKSEYISCSEYTKILFNFSYYYKSDPINDITAYIELLEECKGRKQAEEPYNELLELGNDPYCTALLLEVFSLKLKEVNTLEQVLRLSKNSEDVCRFLSPTLLYNLALGLKWFRDEDIIINNINNNKHGNHHHSHCCCKGCCGDKGCIDAILIKEILVDWKTIFRTDMNSLSILVFAYLLYPEFSLFVTEKYKERFYNKQDIVGNCDVVIQETEGKVSKSEIPFIWNSYFWRHSDVWNNLNIASWFTKEMVNIIDYCRDNDISLDSKTRGGWLNKNLVGKYDMRSLENLYN